LSRGTHFVHQVLRLDGIAKFSNGMPLLARRDDPAGKFQDSADRWFKLIRPSLLTEIVQRQLAQFVLIRLKVASRNLIVLEYGILPGQAKCSRAGFHFNYMSSCALDHFHDRIRMGHPVGVIRRLPGAAPRGEA